MCGNNRDSLEHLCDEFCQQIQNSCLNTSMWNSFLCTFAHLQRAADLGMVAPVKTIIVVFLYCTRCAQMHSDIAMTNTVVLAVTVSTQQN